MWFGVEVLCKDIFCDTDEIIGKHSGVINQMNELVSESESTGCFHHQESLATKKQKSPELSSLVT